MDQGEGMAFEKVSSRNKSIVTQVEKLFNSKRGIIFLKGIITPFVKRYNAYPKSTKTLF